MLGERRQLTRPLQQQRSRGFPQLHNPQFIHVLAGLSASTVFCLILLQSFRPFLAEFTAQLLQSVQIVVTRTVESEPPSLLFTSANGSTVNYALTWTASGLVSIIIFCILFVLLAFPLRGSLLRKTSVLFLGSFVGLLWCIVRLSVFILLAYHFGENAALLGGLVGPFVDFLWVVPVWAVGLSAIASSNRQPEELEEQ